MRGFLAGCLTGILVLPVFAVAVAWLGFWPTHANARPPGWEKAFAQMAWTASAGRPPHHLANQIRVTEKTLRAGMKPFRDVWAGCHGEPSATSDYGAIFYPNVPQFEKEPPRLPDWQLFWIVRNGVRYSGMSAWDGQWHHDLACTLRS